MKFLTMTNSGCVDMCKNMITSANNVGISSNDFIIGCLDQYAFDSMKEYTGSFLFRSLPYSQYCDWSLDENSNFRQIVKYKWRLIENIHAKHQNLCWVDCDIVFKQNPLKVFNENKKYILFQNDTPGTLICSGFMVFNDTDICKKLIFECSSPENKEDDDQHLINRIAKKYSNNIVILPQDLFPNGHVYYNMGNKDNAIIVHNNHMIGLDVKINKFKEEGLWYV